MLLKSNHISRLIICRQFLCLARTYLTAFKPHSAIQEGEKSNKVKCFRYVSEMSICSQYWVFFVNLKRKIVNTHCPLSIFLAPKWNKKTPSALFPITETTRRSLAPTLGNTGLDATNLREGKLYALNHEEDNGWLFHYICQGGTVVHARDLWRATITYILKCHGVLIYYNGYFMPRRIIV